jgi:predicted dienelactone hydrolase
MDHARNREIPVELYFPLNTQRCVSTRPCPVVIFSAGYGINYKNYSFLFDEFNELGYLVVSINHEIKSDAKLEQNGDVRKQLKSMWQRGARNIAFVQKELSAAYQNYDWEHVVLAGHSVGGDSSALRATEDGGTVAALITLDNRRAPLPLSQATRVLSIRAANTLPDPHVLPSKEKQHKFGMCITKIDGSHHSEMHDAGSAELKRKIEEVVHLFLIKENDGSHLYKCEPSSSL